MTIKNFTIPTIPTPLQLAYHCIYKPITSFRHITIICHTHVFLSTVFVALMERRSHKMILSLLPGEEKCLQLPNYGILVSEAHSSFPNRC